MGFNRIFVCLRSGRIRPMSRVDKSWNRDWKIVGKKLITRVKHDFALFIGARICHPSSKIFVVVHDTSVYGIYRVTLLRWLVQRAANLLADRAHSKDLAPDTLMKLTGHTRYRGLRLITPLRLWQTLWLPKKGDMKFYEGDLSKKPKYLVYFSWAWFELFCLINCER